MALKMPIVEIPIDAKGFERFTELFGKYEEKLAKTPGVWQKVNKEFRQTTAAILAQNQAMAELNKGEPGKLRVAESTWRNIAGFTGSALRNTLRISTELLRWGTLIGGGLLGGSLFGLTHMAGEVSGYRRTAKGLGVSYGGLRSADINLSRFVDPGAFLSSINQAISNPALATPLYALGVNPNGSTENVSLATLRAMRRLALSTPRNELGLISQAYGLGPFGGLETLMRLRSTSASEFYQQLQATRRDTGALGLPAGVGRQWQDFQTQLQRAGAEIFKTFVVGLAPLAGPLSKLSSAFSGFLERIMKGPILKEGIDKLANWLNNFSAKLTSKKFESAMDNFLADSGTVAAGLHEVANAMRRLGIGAHVAGKVGGAIWKYNPINWIPRGEAWLAEKGINWLTAPIGIQQNNPGNLKFAHQFGATRGAHGFANFGTPAEGMIAMARQLELYRYRGLDTIGQIVPKYAPKKDHNDVAAYIRALTRSMHVGANTPLNLGDPAVLTRLMNAMIMHEQGRNPYGSLAGRAAVSVLSDSGIVVTARHVTGGNPVLAGAGLAGVPQ